jgi:hypothetical protein
MPICMDPFFDDETGEKVDLSDLEFGKALLELAMDRNGGKR